MKAFGIASALLAATSFITSVAADVDPIVIKGSKFFYSGNGTQFFMRGVAYQQDISTNGSLSGSNKYTDPLADATGCARDIPYLVSLRTNTIRVYAVDPTADHSKCMSMLQDAGIYVVLDLSEPATSINRDTPAWDNKLYSRYTKVVDTFQKYNNVIGFFAGNEVSNNNTNTAASAFVKAAVRDMKAYIKASKYRPMGVGYATNDDAAIRADLASYFNCGSTSDSIDFWGYNIYSWCGDSSYSLSGYDQRTKEFQDYSVPVFFAEYGCNEVRPRKFTEVEALFGDQMSPVWSGGIVYMYFQETNNYGLVDVSGNTVSPRADYTYLSSEMASATPSAVSSGSYNPSNTAARACPTVGTQWQASSNLPPTPNSKLCSCMVSSLSCVAASGLSDTKVAELFGTVCGLGKNVCDGIAVNGTTGVYGAYSMCSSTDKLSFALNAYYQSQNSASSACNFGGNAQTQNAGQASSDCQPLLAQAGPSGTGTVSPSGTTGGTSTPTKTGAGSTLAVPSFDMGLLHVGAYVVFAMLSGAGMILL
ncbi:MAG: 1,3-beta-glucanosyltransferase gas1 [Trizodia sp. TS-e1964]|nr:MAG: 1,3-beta-glucanosyltransferase gas1 [Trizodia sp. TS-e1964]